MAMQDSDVIAKLKRIIDEYGISTFSYHAKANALVSDFFPGGENERTRRLIKALIDCDAFIKISKANSGNIDGVCKSIKYVLVDVESLSEERAEIAICWVCGSMGKRAPKFPQANPAKSNNQSTTSNSNNFGTSSSRPIQPTPQNTNNNMGVNQYGQYGIDPNYVVKRKRVRRNVPKPLIISVIAFVVAIVGGFSVITLINNNKIDTVENLISALPDDENYYLDYQAEIVDAYAAYMELDEKLQGKVENADKLMSVMDGLKVAEAYEQRQNMQFTKLDGGGYSVKLKEGANSKISGELVIPGVYRQEPVVTIEDYAFENCRSITSVTIPDSISKIGLGAFKGCGGLQSISVPFIGRSEDATAFEAVFGFIFGYGTTNDRPYADNSTDFVNTKIGNIEGATWQYSCYNFDYGAYSDARNLQSYYYYIPDSLTSVTITRQSTIPTAAFNGCKNLLSITLPIDSSTTINIGDAAFQGCERLEKYNGGESGILTLQDNVRQIGNRAFFNCKKIKEIIFPKNLNKIGEYSFYGCALITSLDIPEKVEKIEIGAFQGCNNVSSLTTPFVGESIELNAYKSVLGYIFGYTTTNDRPYADNSTAFINTKIGNVEGATWQYSCYNYDYGAYSDARNLQSYYYYIPDTLETVTITKQTEIPTAAFNGCRNIVSISVPSDLYATTTIGAAAFQNCESLVSYNGNSLGQLTLQENVRYIDSYAFSGCKKISNVTFPDKLIRIEKYAFQNCSMMTTIVVPAKVEKIGVGAFKGCNSLTSLTIPFVGESREASAYQAVLGYVFDYETRNSRPYADNSTAFINTKVDSVENATWQYSCYNYDYGAYSNARNLHSYFYYILSTLTTVVVTNQSNVPTAAFNGCTMLETITFEKEINNQGEAAFQNCSATVNKGN